MRHKIRRKVFDGMDRLRNEVFYEALHNRVKNGPLWMALRDQMARKIHDRVVDQFKDHVEWEVRQRIFR